MGVREMCQKTFPQVLRSQLAEDDHKSFWHFWPAKTKKKSIPSSYSKKIATRVMKKIKTEKEENKKKS